MSVRKLAFELSAPALKDADHILAYTLEHWGETQAIKYQAVLNKVFRSIAADPPKGKKLDGFYSILAGKHRIFYRVEARRIYVLRILHQRMDAARHLDAP